MTQAPTVLRKFAGFVRPEKNYFPMPNEWIDICAEIDNLAELKIIQYVIRHTWGFQEYGIPKTISVDEFMYGRKRTNGIRMDNGTGLKSDRSVKDGIKAAIEHGYLICEIDTSDPARMKKSYTLKMIETGVVSTPLNDKTTGVDTTPLTGSIYPPGGYNLPLYQVDTTPRTEKDTIERHYKKDTKETQEREVAHATARSQSSSDEETVKREAVKPSQKDTNKVTHPPAPDKSKTNVTIPKRPKQQPITTPVSPEAQRILDDWVSLFTKKIVINQGDIDAAEHLVPTNITCEEMRQERLWLFSTDNPQKPWYRKIGVCLADIDKKYSQWQSLNEAPKPPADKDESNEHRVSSFGTPGYNFADEFYPSEAEKKRYRAAHAQAQEVRT